MAGDYDILGESSHYSQQHSWLRVTAMVGLYLATTSLVFFMWNAAYDDSLYPPVQNTVPTWWYRRSEARALYYAHSVHEAMALSHDFRLVKNQTTRGQTPGSASAPNSISTLVSLSTRNRGVSNEATEKLTPRLVCYYASCGDTEIQSDLRLSDVNASLCTHINIGTADVAQNASLILPAELQRVLLEEAPLLRSQNAELKLLLWVGGGGANEFATMLTNHTTRKIFVQSLVQTLQKFMLNGVDLDFEFPSAYNKERQHFSQLLYEIRQEYRREGRHDLLSVAVAAPEGIALFAYDVRQINLHADYANLMTYDYHFFSSGSPFTGLNSPLYARSNEHSILGTLNINYSVQWWLANGLDRSKLVVGLPTYGHSFTLVNPFNNAIGAPADAIGRCGQRGFTTYSELCWFSTHNLISNAFDRVTCSPYLSSGTEWISYENEKSIECKARFIKSLQLGGIMAFSLNTDDTKGYCRHISIGRGHRQVNATFPLIDTMKRVLLGEGSR